MARGLNLWGGDPNAGSIAGFQSLENQAEQQRQQTAQDERIRQGGGRPGGLDVYRRVAGQTDPRLTNPSGGYLRADQQGTVDPATGDTILPGGFRIRKLVPNQPAPWSANRDDL